MKPIRASNKGAPTGARLSWVIRNASSREAEIDLFDVIGDPWDGVTAKDFVQQLRGITADSIRLNIASPGGFVDDALAMYDAILNHPAEITAHITVARSAASFVAMAANKRVISKNGAIQIHDAQTFVGVIDLINAGGVDDLIRELEVARDHLNEESDNIAAIYAEVAGGEAADWRKRMQANGLMGTSYRGQEAVDAGLADEVATAPARNMQPGRIAAHVEDDDDEPDEDEPPAILTDLIPPLANGYKPPLPTDFTRLVAANMPAAKKE